MTYEWPDMLPNSKTKFNCCHLLFKKESLAPHMGTAHWAAAFSPSPAHLPEIKNLNLSRDAKSKIVFSSSSWNNLLSISGCVVPCLTPFQLSKVNLLSIPAPISCYTRQIEEISQKSFRFLSVFCLSLPWWIARRRRSFTICTVTQTYRAVATSSGYKYGDHFHAQIMVEDCTDQVHSLLRTCRLNWHS